MPVLAATATTVTSSRDAQAAASPALALLADHLNAVLRHGEALRAIERPEPIAAFAGPGVPAMIRRNRQIDAIAQEAHALELTIILRLSQARVMATQGKRDLPHAGGLLRLVASVADLVAGERTAPASATDFLASRGVTSSPDTQVLGEGYRIAGKAPLGDVMDAAAAALDMLDALAISTTAERSSSAS
jgi:hypothetical protein